MPTDRTTTRRRFLATTGGLGAVGLLAACGGSGAANQTPANSNGGVSYHGPKVTIKFWNGWTGADGLTATKMIKQFNAQTRNIQVQASTFQWVDFLQKLPAGVQSGNGPDVAVMHIDDMPTMAAQGILVPVADVAKALGLTENDFAAAVWNGGMYNGKRYSIPVDVHNLALFYNKTLMQRAGLDPSKPPTNSSEYLAACAELKRHGIQGSWVSPMQFTGGFWFESLLWQFGGNIFDPQVTKATWDSPAGVEALTWLVNLIKAGYSPRNVGQDEDYIALKDGKNVFNWQGIWQVNDVEALTSYEVGVAPVPKIGPNGGVWGNSHQFTIPRQASVDVNKSNASRYFINWFTRNELEWATSAKVPANRTLAASPQFQSMKLLPQFAKEMDEVHFPPSRAGIDDALTELYSNGVPPAVLGKQSPAAALASSAAQATRILQSNRQKYGQ